MSSRINALARRVQDDTDFLASALADYGRSEGLNSRGLARVLGCDEGRIGALGLCRRPRSEPALFRRDVDRIAAYFGVDAEVLAQAVRRSDAVAMLRREAEAERGMMIAARDRAEEKSLPREPST